MVYLPGGRGQQWWWECQTVWASWGRGRACVRGGEAAAATKHEARVFFVWLKTSIVLGHSGL
ncbi:hypothetical protein ERO13_A09G136124v2 [Gossypium hirsutum]|uniref:Uncharacterized protein n=1 Tax=Gossypium tomentosum TaxID=34277 RepID=A0A5D2J8X2_GOSTO|nr:hypothetical protein ERO13_A09G136112v2 [Gossypium hirsutum]KAG4183897.1 hypothetical protein ERO13_A09G136124v2 [Gossypium hirsutum]TYH50796.1 hypothetical protein ES332_D10G230200v1 [Gossypium tomentosum]